MKKFLALLVSALMLITPVLSLAEASDLTVRVSLNEQLVTELGGDEGAMIAALAELFSIGLHTQDNQFRAMINFNDASLVDVIAEVTDDAILLGSSLLDDTVISVPADLIVEAVNSISQVTDTSDSTNISFDKTLAALENAMVITEEPVAEWTEGTVAPATLVTYTLPKDQAETVLNAILEDVADSGKADAILSRLGQDVTFDDIAAEMRESLPSGLPDSDDLLIAMIGVDENGEFVYLSMACFYKEEEVVDYDFVEITAEDGSTDYELVETKDIVGKTVALEMYQMASDDLTWSGSAMEITEGSDYTPYYTFEFSMFDEGLVCTVDVGSISEENGEEMDNEIALTIAADENEVDFHLALLAIDSSTGDMDPIGSLLVTFNAADPDALFAAYVYLANYEEPLATLSVTSAPGEELPSIADGETILVTDLNEETLEALGEKVMNNLSSLVGAFLGGM